MSLSTMQGLVRVNVTSLTLQARRFQLSMSRILVTQVEKQQFYHEVKIHPQNFDQEVKLHRSFIQGSFREYRSKISIYFCFKFFVGCKFHLNISISMQRCHLPSTLCRIIIQIKIRILLENPLSVTLDILSFLGLSSYKHALFFHTFLLLTLLIEL